MNDSTAFEQFLSTITVLDIIIYVGFALMIVSLLAKYVKDVTFLSEFISRFIPWVKNKREITDHENRLGKLESTLKSYKDETEKLETFYTYVEADNIRIKEIKTEMGTMKKEMEKLIDSQSDSNQIQSLILLSLKSQISHTLYNTEDTKKELIDNLKSIEQHVHNSYKKS